MTDRQNIFTWGRGSDGRLGHGETDDRDQDHLRPKEIYTLSQRKPLFVAAGESHSAAISENLNLFTWGNGGFGRLGHPDDFSENAPKRVEELLDFEVIQVSCGSFHTLVQTATGEVFAFGQNKYSKLGIYSKSPKEGEAFLTPERIYLYRAMRGQKPVKDNMRVDMLFAGLNHSIGLNANGQIFSWGYKGKELLGRDHGHYGLALPAGSNKKRIRTGLTDF